MSCKNAFRAGFHGIQPRISWPREGPRECRLRLAKTASDNKKGRLRPPWFLPIAAVPRDENAAAPGMVKRQAQNKSRVGKPTLLFPPTTLISGRRLSKSGARLFVSFRFGPGYL